MGAYKVYSIWGMECQVYVNLTYMNNHVVDEVQVARFRAPPDRL